MPLVVPSQVVGLIDQMFPWVENAEPRRRVGMSHSSELAGVVDLLDQVPHELITVQGRDHAALVCSRAAIRDLLAIWRATANEQWVLGELRGFGEVHALVLLRDALEKCPDNAPSPSTSALPFITDADLRESIRLDLSSAHSDLAQGEWKGATVLAGSAIEALLLWALQQHEHQHAGARQAAIAALRRTKTLTRQPDPNPERWDLHEYVEVAAHLGIVKPDTATLVRLAKDFRNLIHPGRAARLGQKCGRPEALGALAAVEAVARDLGP
ncbi:MAG: hypothetical protein HY727_05685 [Candidatus Rokubacteria bacterium]|nr:hypothetical protein [Candidatus Rokubacteria bacterium]